MNNIKGKKIAIIGGGPGGLTLARLLQPGGADVKVYERDENRDVRTQGATLDLHEESGLEALRRAGLIDAFRKHYRPGAGKLRVLDGNANIVMDDHASEEPGEEQRPEIDRGPLREILIDSLAQGTIVWNSRFASMEVQSNGRLLHFANGSHAYADLVVAADGANSRVRRYLTDIKPVYSGITIVEGNIYNAQENAPILWNLLKGGKIFALASGQSIILSAKGDGTMSFYTGSREAETWVRDSGIDFCSMAQVQAWFKKEFASWGSAWGELFAANDISIIPRPQYHFPTDQHWPTNNSITLLGDAAHRMPPYAGEGVNMAMQDAYELAECLQNDSYGSMGDAIAAYETKMLQRAAKVTQVTLQQTEMLHCDNGLNNLLNMFREYEG